MIMGGEFSSEQEEALKPYIEGQVIHDLGSGLGIQAQWLLKLGASHIYCVDKNPHPSEDDRITDVKSTFFNYHIEDRSSIAFLSWPVNRNCGHEALVSQVDTVIYLGCNTCATACGGQELWRRLMLREVLLYSPRPKNDLIVYGPKYVSRDPLPEEIGATSGTMYYWHELHNG